MLAVANLSASYGRIPALANIGFAVERGECVGIWGHNGMGKTTLLKTIMGYLAAQTGSISFLGQDITRSETHHRARLGIGLVPQGRQIFPNLSVRENLEVGAAVLSPEKTILDKALATFPRLKPLLERKGGFLSGGEQQLLALARCLCGQPKVLLLDEPAEGIQPSIVEEISETLIGLRQREHLTMIVVEQKRDFIVSLASRVLVMEKGRVTKELPVKALAQLDEI